MAARGDISRDLNVFIYCILGLLVLMIGVWAVVPHLPEALK